MGITPMTETRKLRVFLCHSSQDKPTVRELYQRLLAEGWIDPWLDEEKIIPGQDRQITTEIAVLNTDIAIICLTKNSKTKEGYLQREFRIVLDILIEKPEGSICIIPLKLEDCELPRQLANWQSVDYYPSYGPGNGYMKLLETLRVDARTRISK
jgi:hypothetical protein